MFKFTNYPGAGQTHADASSATQGVRVGDTVYISGQGGWDDNVVIIVDPKLQVAKAFENAEKALIAAGAVSGLKSVFKFVIYVTDIEVYGGPMIEYLQNYYGTATPSIPPATVVKVAGLWFPNMGIEVDATALAQ